MTNRQNAFGSLVCGPSEVDRPFGMEQDRVGFFHKKTPGIGELHNSPFVASEERKSALHFEIGNLFTQCRLGNV